MYSDTQSNNKKINIEIRLFEHIEYKNKSYGMEYIKSLNWDNFEYIPRMNDIIYDKESNNYYYIRSVYWLDQFNMLIEAIHDNFDLGPYTI